MSESTAFAVATQQSHALGKTPKSYGTKGGRARAKSKYDSPKNDEQVADPKEAAVMMAAFHDEVMKQAGLGSMFNTGMKHIKGIAGSAMQHVDTSMPLSPMGAAVAGTKGVMNWMGKKPPVMAAVPKPIKGVANAAFDAFDKAAEKQASMAGGLALVLSGNVVREGILHNLKSKMTEHLSDEKRDKHLTDKLLSDAPVAVDRKKGVLGGEYDLAADKVNLGEKVNPAILAHELGHADLARSIPWSILQNRATVIAANSAAHPILPLIAGVLAGGGNKASAAALPIAARVPQLIYEAAASYKGLDRLEEAGATKEELDKARGLLIKAYATYAADSGATVGNVLLGHTAGRHLARALGT